MPVPQGFYDLSLYLTGMKYAVSMITMGASGLLIVAKRRGLIASISPGIEALRDGGLWLSDGMVNIL